MRNIIHTRLEIAVEIPDDCVTIVTSDTMYIRYKIWINFRDSFISSLRLYSYIADDQYCILNDNITVLKQSMIYKSQELRKINMSV